jgi:hypothetical protein
VYRARDLARERDVAIKDALLRSRGCLNWLAGALAGR